MIIATLRMLTSTLDKRVLSLPESMQVSWHRHKPQEVAVVDSFALVGDEKRMRMMSAGQDVQSRLPMVFVQRRVNQHQEKLTMQGFNIEDAEFALGQEEKSEQFNSAINELTEVRKELESLKGECSALCEGDRKSVV